MMIPSLSSTSATTTKAMTTTTTKTTRVSSSSSSPYSPSLASSSSSSRWKSRVAASTTVNKRRLWLQVILVWTLAVLLLVNRRILVSYHRSSSSSSQSSSSNNINILMALLPTTTLTHLAPNDTTTTTSSTSSSSVATSAITAASFKFYILVVPNMTTALLTRYSGGDVGNNATAATAEAAAAAATVYARFFNEDRAEMWLHRGLSSLTYEQGQTMDPYEADVFFIPGYLHYWRNQRSVLLSSYNKNESAKQEQLQQQEQQQQQTLTEQVLSVIVNKTKPHVLLIPTRDVSMNRLIGLKGLVLGLQKHGLDNNNLYSVGFERNSWWQTVPTDRIIPIPYVVEPPPPPLPPQQVSSTLNSNNIPVTVMFQNNRTENFVFFSAHPRPNAVTWSGCNRSMISPLIGRQDDTTMDIRLVTNAIKRRRAAAASGGAGATRTVGHHYQRRMTQKLYNQRMQTSDYCLILCGDTPTSRSLASAMMAGCIPLRVGSWWRGL